uniref:ATP synthase F(0) complex subunit e, mitochondrial n=1 Tax=Oreochromis aureus TaxID=47969 RepID=A0A668T9L2_OREAU
MVAIYQRLTVTTEQAVEIKLILFICRSSRKTARWSALLLGVIYGKQRFDYLKPIAEEERRVEEAEKKAREEQERIYKQLSEANSDTILK